MSTVTPPPPPPPPVPQLSAQPSAVVSNPPTTLSSVAAGTRIDAIIVATTPDGRVEVETKLGRFLMQPNVALPKEGPIQLQVQTLARHLFVTITSIHGKQPAVALRGLGLAGGPAASTGGLTASATGTAASAAAATPQSQSAPPAQLAAGATITATVLKSVQQGPSNLRGAGGTAAATGTAGGMQTANKTAGTQASASSAQATATGSSGQANSAAGARAAAAYGGQTVGRAAPGGTVMIPSGNAYTVRVTGLQNPAPGAPTPTAPTVTGPAITSGQVLSGIVSASPSPNATVVQTHAGPISLAAPANLPVGTTVQLEVLSQLPNQSNGVDGTASKRMGLFMLQSRQWPALDEAFNALRESNPTAAMQLINAAMPRPDAALAANILQFLMGVRSGEVAAWIGDGPARALQRDKPDILNRLREDFRSLGRLAEEPVSGDWRALPVPMASGAEIQQIQLLMRKIQGDEEDKEDRPGPGTRFIVDVDLSRMGRLQLDGYVQDDTMRFDLVIRSEARLADKVQNDIRAIFEETEEITGTSGGLSFQAAPPKFIEVSSHDLADDVGLVV